MGILYIVATPIGNLGDITFRAVEILKSVDFILCEDTRISLKLLNLLNIKNKLISFYQSKEKTFADKIVEKIKYKDTSVALITDNGTPSISDPGYLLVKKCYENGIEVIPIPGPSALTAALSICGFSTDKSYFLGFLPKKKGKKRKELQKAKNVEGLIIIYESPFRIKETLEMIVEIFGKDTNIFIGRELTKKFEEKIRGKIEYILQNIADKNLKGEIILIVENYLLFRK